MGMATFSENKAGSRQQTEDISVREVNRQKTDASGSGCIRRFHWIRQSAYAGSLPRANELISNSKTKFTADAGPVNSDEHLSISRFIRLLFALWTPFIMVGMAVLVSGVLLLAKLPRNLTDPFPPDILGLLGQSKNAVIAAGFICRPATANPPPGIAWHSNPREICSMHSSLPYFRRIQVLTVHQLVRGISFEMRHHTILMGDLAAQWGTPQIVVAKWNTTQIEAGTRVTDFTWKDFEIRAWVRRDGGNFDYFLPVYKIQIELNEEVEYLDY
jgi:hypothetical protein